MKSEFDLMKEDRDWLLGRLKEVEQMVIEERKDRQFIESVLRVDYPAVWEKIEGHLLFI